MKGPCTLSGHPVEFLWHEVKQGRPGMTLMPRRMGIGTIASAVPRGLLDPGEPGPRTGERFNANSASIPI